MKKLIGFIALFLVFSAFSAEAQIVMKKRVALNSVPFYVATDTVTNTATNFVTNVAAIPGPLQNVTIQANLVKISGAVGGTLTLQGSVDGVNFKALPTLETQTALATATPADVATQSFIWRITNNPVPYYRLSWTGTGTMSATLAGTIIAH